MYDPSVIVDFHTHIFPPAVLAEREHYVALDATFAELYSNPKARLAGGDDLLASMDAAAIDVSVALGFAWHDEALCRAHNDYLLDAAAKSHGRIVPFCTLPLAAGPAATAAEAKRCSAAGAAGFGELRLESLLVSLDDEETTDALVEAVGGYPDCPLDSIWLPGDEVTYIRAAPGFVNARFPAVIESGALAVFRCNTGEVQAGEPP